MRTSVPEWKGLVRTMARVCFICGKCPKVANLVSHAKNRVKRWVYPNVHKVRFVIAGCADTTVHSSNVCTKCVKARKIKRVI